VLARSWDTTIAPSIGDRYYEAARYNYEHPAVKPVFDDIWDSTYLAILNINVALSKIDKKREVLSTAGYNLIKSELLALRAYLHFDLLRMFGPDNPVANLNTVVLPYMNQVTANAVNYHTANEILQRCSNDLDMASALASKDIVTRGRIGYWGMIALKARVQLYKGDYVKAAAAANEVISGGKFPLVTTNADFQFLREMVFSLFVSAPQLSQNERSILNTTPSLGLSPNGQNFVFVASGGSLNDWRRLSQFVTISGATTPANAVMLPRKWYHFSSPVVNVVPMIRMAEMYYIAAEAANENQDSVTATSLLNAVRQARNFPANSLTNLTRAAVQAEIQKEYMKEFVGEGQVFYYFKRRNLDINSLPLTKVAPIAGAVYAFPVPE
jgi:hypothetical protein